MNPSDYGVKHVCLECATKYYDLNREIVSCPQCGTKPPAIKSRKAAPPARKTGRTTFGRFT